MKASEELRDRVKEIVGEEKGYLVNISTFHSFCRQVLREDIDKLGRGYARNFRALEENDQRKIVKNLARINEQRVRAEIEHIQSYKFPNPDEVLNFITKNAYCQQALDHEKSERYRKSINLLQKAENIHPNCEKTHYYLGRVYFKIDRLKDARAHANKALSIQPNYPRSQKLLKEIKDARNWLKLGGKQVRRLVSRIAKHIGF